MKHRVLVVGTGSIGTRHVRCMLKTGRAQVGICEPNAKFRERVAGQYALAGVYSRLEDALEESWDAAVVAVPASLHVPIAQQLADHGVGVLIEKPLAVEESGLAHLRKTIQKSELPSGVAYLYRAHPAARAVREALLGGRFGKPLQVICVTGQPFAHLRPAYRDIYYAHHQQGGGAIQDGLTHWFNLCEWLMGPITSIAVDAEHMRLEGIEVEDTVNAMARHSKTVMASYAMNHHQAPNEAFVMVVCESGTLRLELKKHRWSWLADPGGEWQIETTNIREHDDWFTLQSQAFLDHIEGVAPPLCSLEEGWQTLRVNRASLVSASEGGAWQKIKPVSDSIRPVKTTSTVRSLQRRRSSGVPPLSVSPFKMES